jgi:hypothetical protein
MVKREEYTVGKCPNCSKDWNYLMIENVVPGTIGFQCKACNYSFTFNKHTKAVVGNKPKFVEEGKGLKRFAK